MTILKFMKKKANKGHSFQNQHPLNFISKDPETEGMLCRRVDKNSLEFEVLPRLKNLGLALGWLNIGVRYNEFTRFVEILGETKPVGPGVLDDAKLAVIADKLEETYGLKFTDTNLSSKLGVLARRNKYDPLVNFYLSLSWDNVDRADRIWIDYANSEDTPLNRAYGRLFATCMVARCFYPGIKVDEVITLIGDQGGGKSTLAKALTPIDESAFSDQVVIGSDSKKILEQTRGKALLEHAEDWRGRYSEQQRKACLSTAADRARGAYQKLAEEIPRRFMFIATTNSDFPIQDPTGARREWLVQTKGQFKPLKAQTRDQIYAEVMQKYILPAIKSEKPESIQRQDIRKLLVLPKELWPEQAKVADSYRAPPALAMEVKITMENLQWPTEISMDHLLEKLSYKNGVVATPKSANQKIGEAMKWLGYASKRKNVKGGGKMMYYVWNKPGKPEDYLEGDVSKIKYS